MLVEVKNLEVCPRVRVRKRKPDQDTIERYAEAYKAGAVMEPVVVYQENGTKRYIVADGEHRLEAAKLAKLSEIDAEIRKGDEIDALEFALGCNAEHGLPRTAADIRFAYTQLRENPALSERIKTNQDRADLLKVSIRTVQRCEAEWRESKGGDKETRKAKKKAQKNAEKNTAPEKKTEETIIPRTARVTAVMVPDDIEPSWTADDERTYGNIFDAWQEATPAARRQFLREQT